MSRISVFNAVDGVGKTTTAVNLLAGIARRGARPLGIDLSPTARLTAAFGTAVAAAEDSSVAFFERRAELAEIARVSASGVIVCPAHDGLARVARTIGKGPAAITRLALELRKPTLANGVTVMDCAGTFDVPTLNALFASDLLVVPLAPDETSVLAARRVERALAALEPVLQRRLPRRYLLTRVDASHPQAVDFAARVGEAFPAVELFATRIHEDGQLQASLAAGIDVFRYAPASRGAADYQALISELSEATLSL